jgi:endo-1,4-beta-xylanase
MAFSLRLFAALVPVGMIAAACSSNGSTPDAGGGSGGSSSDAGSFGGQAGAGGSGGTAGASGTGGTAGAGGSGGTAGASGLGGTAGAGGTGGSGGTAGAGGTGGSGGTAEAGVSGDAGDAGTCTVGAMPTGGTTQTGSNINGMADGLGYGVWSNGSGGSITTFAKATAFSASWNNGGDFLAHLGLDFNSSQSYTAYGTIAAQFAESKTGTGGGFSSIGMYGWMQDPCVEWYIVEDSFNGMPTKKSSVTVTIDGGTYYVGSNTTSGTGGNDCNGGASQWTQMWSVRTTARECGTITVSDHFAAWKAQGWSLGNLTSVHVNVEVGGGTGSIELPMADVTTTSN